MPEASEEVFLLRAVEKPASFNAGLGHPVLESAGHYSPLHKEARGHCMRGSLLSVKISPCLEFKVSYLTTHVVAE